MDHDIDVTRLITHGTVVLDPKCTKQEVLEHNSRMYAEVEALRTFIIENMLMPKEKKKSK